MADNETIADIIAWLRRPREGENAYLTLWRDEIADRFDAAHKREVREAVTDCNQFSDVAKLREALKLCVDEMCDRCRELAVARGNPLPCLSGCEPVRKAKAAIAAPPRNCDVIGNTGRALVVHGFPTKNNQWGEGEWLEFIDWLFAPATEKEGGNDGNE